jgi:hypothetical protein
LVREVPATGQVEEIYANILKTLGVPPGADGREGGKR